MKKQSNTAPGSQGGFTLLEVLIAMGILSIGIIALTTLQTTAIQGNATANRITESTSWASDRAEQIFSWAYDDARLKDIRDVSLDNDENPDHGPVTEGNYSIVWNVEDGPIDQPDPDMVKTIRVIVTRSDQDSSKRVSFDYTKMKFMN